MPSLVDMAIGHTGTVSRGSNGDGGGTWLDRWRGMIAPSERPTMAAAAGSVVGQRPPRARGSAGLASVAPSTAAGGAAKLLPPRLGAPRSKRGYWVDRKVRLVLATT